MSELKKSFPARKKIALDNRKLTLTTKCPTAEGKWSNLYWGLYSNNPRLTVYTGDPADKGFENGKIAGHLGANDFFALIQSLREAATQENNWREKWELKNYTFYGGKRSEHPTVVAELWIGKTKEGVIWISIVDPKNKDRPRIQFPFMPNDFTSLYSSDGNPLDKSKVSALYAKGYANVLDNLVAHLLVTEYVDESAKTSTQKKEGGNNYGNTSKQQSSDVSDEDFPF